ncbi:MAG: RPA12/RPB9/RPC11 RNA polymerase family protein [Candidatus Odinarchaeota archaeon]
MVVFCDDCGALIMPKKDRSGKMQLICSKCGWKSSADIEDKYTVKEQIIRSPKDQTIVIDDTEEINQFPTVTETCRRCGHTQAYYFESQDSRGAEYEHALYYRCRKCGYIWKA